jgi:hypothetical protein
MTGRCLTLMTVALIGTLADAANAQVVQQDQLTPREVEALKIFPAGSRAVRIGHWPDDVPCSSLRHDPDGFWDLKDVLFIGSVIVGQERLRNTAETKLFERKCGDTLAGRD